MRFAAAVLITTSLALTGQGTPKQKELSGQRRIEHALVRLTWGPRPGDVERVRQAGLDRWIEEQLHPDQVAENPELQARLSGMEPLSKDTPALIAAFRNRKDDKKEGKADLRAVPRAVVEAKVLRAVYTNRQLEDVLTDFWFNHFNVFIAKGADRVLTGTYERDAIRPHVLGKFRDLLGATAEHPAMLFYLDNWRSASPDSWAAKRAKRATGLNENYARELLELHTLGADGGYTQKDVQEVARCFTGWTIRENGSAFAPGMHDRGEKTVLGQRIHAGGGRKDGERVLDIVARHPSTARFLSRKLAQRFVSDNPPDALVNTMAATFTKTGGDLRAVMKTMLGSKAFWDESAYASKLKSPFEYVVSAVRSGEAEMRNPLGLAQEAAQMGQPLYRKQEPTGYGNTGEEWTNSAGLLARMNFAGKLAHSRVPGVRVTWPDTDHKAVELRIGSPAFQRR